MQEENQKPLNEVNELETLITQKEETLKRVNFHKAMLEKEIPMLKNMKESYNENEKEKQV